MLSGRTNKWPPWFYEPLAQSQLPVSHRAVTLHGLVITFQILAWMAVAFRIYYRSFSARVFGWDDVFVLLSLCTTTINTILICLSTKYGLGQHYGVVITDNDMLIGWYKIYFFSTLLYFLSATLIKNSILFQYLRLFQQPEHRLPRFVCLGFIVLVSVWGSLFFFIQLFSCSPVSDAWKTSANANCRLLMSFSLYPWLAGFITHAVTNMLLDYFVFCLPIVFRRHLEIENRGRRALIALFTMGGCVATISAIRLILIIANKGGIHPTQDASWYAPAIMIPSALEIQTAVICASIPIFWPLVARVLRLDQIIVTREVTLHSEARSVAPGLRGWKRHSESSETELRDLTGSESGNCSGPENSNDVLYNKDPYTVGWQVTNDGLLDGDVGNRATARATTFSHKKRPVVITMRR